MFIFQIVGASATKKYGGKNVLLISVLLWSLSTFLVPFFAHSIYALLISRVILGLGEGLGKLLFCRQSNILWVFYSRTI